MIEIIIDKIIGAYTEGFEVAVDNSTVTFNGGKIAFTENNEIFEFEAFGFDIVPDNELPVIYNIFLCGDNTVAVTRHELAVDVLPVYEGDKELLHLLGVIEIMPNQEEVITLRLLEEIVDGVVNSEENK